MGKAFSADTPFQQISECIIVIAFGGGNHGESDDEQYSPKPSEPFRLSRLIRHPIDPSEDFGLGLDGIGASTDEWIDLGLDFEDYDSAWVAGCILSNLIPKDYAPWLGGDEHDPVIKVTEHPNYPFTSYTSHNVDRPELKSVVTSLIGALTAARKAVDESADRSAVLARQSKLMGF